MAQIRHRSILSGMKTREAMQSHTIGLPPETSIKSYISHMIKHKANTAMVIDGNQTPLGVVSKTDIMGAFYAGLPVDTRIGDIMTGPLVTCRESDSIEKAIQAMKSHQIHQIYVESAKAKEVIGLMTWSDIMGLLYRYCRTCVRSGRQESKVRDESVPRLFVKDVMTHDVVFCRKGRDLTHVIEILSERKLGAVLVTDPDGRPAGIISKSDLILAFGRGADITVRADTVMNHPVTTCLENDLLSDAVSVMLLFDIQRIFVKKEHFDRITGVLSLSDTARLRSGTCRACAAGRVLES